MTAPTMAEAGSDWSLARHLPPEWADRGLTPLQRVAELEQHIHDFIRALDRGYLDCKDDSAFIDALRDAVSR